MAMEEINMWRWLKTATAHYTPTRPIPRFGPGASIKYRAYYEAPMLYGTVSRAVWVEDVRVAGYWEYILDLTRTSRERYARHYGLRCWADVQPPRVSEGRLSPWDGEREVEVCACGEVHEP